MRHLLLEPHGNQGRSARPERLRAEHAHSGVNADTYGGIPAFRQYHTETTTPDYSCLTNVFENVVIMALVRTCCPCRPQVRQHLHRRRPCRPPPPPPRSRGDSPQRPELSKQARVKYVSNMCDAAEEDDGDARDEEMFATARARSQQPAPASRNARKLVSIRADILISCRMPKAAASANARRGANTISAVVDESIHLGSHIVRKRR